MCSKARINKDHPSHPSFTLLPRSALPNQYNCLSCTTKTTLSVLLTCLKLCNGFPIAKNSCFLQQLQSMENKIIALKNFNVYPLVHTGKVSFALKCCWNLWPKFIKIGKSFLWDILTLLEITIVGTLEIGPVEVSLQIYSLSCNKCWSEGERRWLFLGLTIKQWTAVESEILSMWSIWQRDTLRPYPNSMWCKTIMMCLT